LAQKKLKCALQCGNELDLSHLKVEALTEERRNEIIKDTIMSFGWTTKGEVAVCPNCLRKKEDEANKVLAEAEE
jgi:hypothetical protein